MTCSRSGYLKDEDECNNFNTRTPITLKAQFWQKEVFTVS